MYIENLNLCSKKIRKGVFIMNEIPNFKVGTDLKEVANYVRANVKDSAVQQSIFNMIEDDSKFGDGKISNKGELQILKNLLSGTKNMPPEVQAEESSHMFNSKMLSSVEKENGDGSEEETIYVDNKHRESKYSNLDQSYDTFFDFDQDGKMDSRSHIRFQDSESRIEYYDEDADGTFDRKSVHKNGVRLIYEKGKDGEWRLTDQEF